MKQVKIITDSCSDLTPDLMEKYDIDYAQMNTVLDGKTSPASLAWTPGEVHEFYNAFGQTYNHNTGSRGRI